MKVAYFTNIQSRMDVGGNYAIKESKSDLGSFNLGCDHPMEPQRLRMLHSLVLSLGIADLLTIHSATPCSDETLRFFHSREYLDFLSKEESISPDQACMHNIGPVEEGIDCTAFPGVWEYSRTIVGASIEAARLLRSGKAQIAINWSGGLHHAKIHNASGFCYLNDCVLAILELLQSMTKVLYIDIDFHHGDGVEEAFYISDKVFTLSFHRLGQKVFPGTGALTDCGLGRGKGYCVNVPLLAGIRDEPYLELFKEIVSAVVERFGPEAIVLQAGADSLVGDTVGLENGGFNLSTDAHKECIAFVKNLNKPLLVLGGGGYSKTAVAKCWAAETAILCGKKISQNIPKNDFYFNEYKGDTNLCVSMNKDSVDFNTPGRLMQIRNFVLSNICPKSFSS